MPAWHPVFSISIDHEYFHRFPGDHGAAGTFTLRPSAATARLFRILRVQHRSAPDALLGIATHVMKGPWAAWQANPDAQPITLFLESSSHTWPLYSNLDHGPASAGDIGSFYLSNRYDPTAKESSAGLTLGSANGKPREAVYLTVCPAPPGTPEDFLLFSSSEKPLGSATFNSSDACQRRPIAILQLYPPLGGQGAPPQSPGEMDPGARFALVLSAREVPCQYEVHNDSNHFPSASLRLVVAGQETAASSLLSGNTQPVLLQPPGLVPLQRVGSPRFSLWSANQQLMDLPLPSPSNLAKAGDSEGSLMARMRVYI